MDGRKAWYNLVREDPEPLWENNPPADDQQDWITMMTRIVFRLRVGLGYVFRRLNNAAAVI